MGHRRHPDARHVVLDVGPRGRGGAGAVEVGAQPVPVQERVLRQARRLGREQAAQDRSAQVGGARARRPDGDEAEQALRVPGGQRPPDPAAEVVTDDDGPLGPEGPDERVDVVGETGQVVAARGGVGRAVPAQVGRHGAVPRGREAGQDAPPGVPVLQRAVQEQDQRRPGVRTPPRRGGSTTATWNRMPWAPTNRCSQGPGPRRPRRR